MTESNYLLVLNALAEKINVLEWQLENAQDPRAKYIAEYEAKIKELKEENAALELELAALKAK